VRYRSSNRRYGILGTISWVIALISAVYASSLKIDASVAKLRFGQGFANALSLTSSYAWICLPLLTIAVPLCNFLRESVGNPRSWKAVHRILDDFRNDLFDQTSDDPIHANRVTLFKRVKYRWSFRERWYWPMLMGGWLVPVERSGHTSQTSNTVFRASSDGLNVEGVAGQAWSRKKIFIVEKHIDTENIEDYLTRSKTPDRMQKRLSADRRSYVGIPIELAGDVWGVIVIDSVLDRVPYSTNRKEKKKFTQLAKTLTIIIEGL
jgi:hypothetical protein